MQNGGTMRIRSSHENVDHKIKQISNIFIRKDFSSNTEKVLSLVPNTCFYCRAIPKYTVSLYRPKRVFFKRLK